MTLWIKERNKPAAIHPFPASAFFRPAFLASLGQSLAQASAIAFTEALKSPGKKHQAKRSFRKNA